METTRKKIIYVDDVNLHLVSVKNRLKNHYEVYPAQSTAKLFELLNHIRPDLILLDVNMPDTDGFETMQLLHQNDSYRSIPVIFLTSQFDRNSIYKGLNCGAVGYVKKPFSDETLLEQIESALRPTQSSTPAPPPPVAEPAADGKPSILAIDDAFVMLKTIHYALRDLYKVYTLTNPHEIQEVLRRVSPDLFLLDINMPGLGGFELMPMIRAIPAHKDTPVIFITANGASDQIVQAVGLGACDFIVKPVNLDILREKVAKHIRAR